MTAKLKRRHGEHPVESTLTLLTNDWRSTMDIRAMHADRQEVIKGNALINRLHRLCEIGQAELRYFDGTRLQWRRKTK